MAQHGFDPLQVSMLRVTGRPIIPQIADEGEIIGRDRLLGQRGQLEEPPMEGAVYLFWLEKALLNRTGMRNRHDHGTPHQIGKGREEPIGQCRTPVLPPMSARPSGDKTSMRALRSSARVARS